MIDTTDLHDGNNHGMHPIWQSIVLAVGVMCHFAQDFQWGYWYNVVFKILALSSTFFLFIINGKKAFEISIKTYHTIVSYFKKYDKKSN